MRITNMKDVEPFRAAVKQCVGNVYLKSAEGDVFNLKSSLSEYIALGRLLGEAGAALELMADLPEDEALLQQFLSVNP